jgi:hypothetical protein
MPEPCRDCGTAMAAGSPEERRQHSSTRGAKKQLPRNGSGGLWQNIGSLQRLCLTDPASAFSESHGGLTPAALVRSSHRRRMVGDFRRTAFGLPTTAGSRPPLLWACVCTSQKSVFRRRTFARQQKSGGRKPPVGCIRCERETRKFVSLQLQTRVYKHTAGSRPPLLWACVCTSQMSYSAPNGRGAIKSGWRKPAVVWGTHLQVICEKSRTSFDRPNTTAG